MAAKTLLRNVAGRITEVLGVVTGGTAGQAGDIVALDDTGRIDASLLPTGIGADVYVTTAGESLTAGDMVYISATGTALRASATAAGQEAQGFVLAASANAAPATVYFEGRDTGLTGMTPGARYFLSDTTPGGVTNVPVTGAGKKLQFLGTAVTATQLNFEPDPAITLAV